MFPDPVATVVFQKPDEGAEYRHAYSNQRAVEFAMAAQLMINELLLLEELGYKSSTTTRLWVLADDETVTHLMAEYRPDATAAEREAFDAWLSSIKPSRQPNLSIVK